MSASQKKIYKTVNTGGNIAKNYAPPLFRDVNVEFAALQEEKDIHQDVISMMGCQLYVYEKRFRMAYMGM